jgi:two-component system, sensor histidine kinase PdtaS
VTIRRAGGEGGHAMTEHEDFAAEPRPRAEKALRESEDRTGLDQEERENSRRLVHELRVYQVELELQNEELRATRAKAEESLAQYLDLYEFAPVPYLTVDLKGRVLKANLSCAASLGIERSCLVGSLLGEFLAPEARPGFGDFLERTIASGHQNYFEVSMRRGDGEALFAHVVGLGRDGNDGECRLALIDIAERERSRQALERAGQEKALLMRELQHRVKNSLNVVYSLLGLGESQIEGLQAKEALGKAKARVMAMSHIYEQLYQAGEVLSIDLRSYLEQLMVPLLETYTVDISRFRLVTKFESANLDAQRAALAGLMFSELISNATKYAYPPGRSGELRVSLLGRDGMFELCVADDGPGLPPDFDPAATSSMGFYLLRMLADQMGAELKVASSPGGGVSVSLIIKP